MLEQLIGMKYLVEYVVAAELFFLALLSLRTNSLLKKTMRLKSQRREQVSKLKEEIKKGNSDIPVVKFEKPKGKAAAEKEVKQAGGMDPKEIAVLQDMMSEFFG